MERRWKFQQNGESFNHACCKFYLIGCWWGVVPTTRFSVFVTLGCNNRAESFYVLQTRRDFTEDSRESWLILWRILVVVGFMFQVAFHPLAQPSGCTLVRFQIKRCHQHLQCFKIDCLKERKDAVAFGCEYDSMPKKNSPAISYPMALIMWWYSFSYKCVTLTWLGWPFGVLCVCRRGGGGHLLVATYMPQ